MTKVTALTQLGSILEATSTIKKAHVYPPESLQVFPCVVLEWLRGTLGMAAAGSPTNELCTALAAVYVNRQVLYTASETARPVIDEVRDALNGNASLNSTCLTVEEIRFEGPGAMPYGEATNRATHYGFRFEIDIRFKDNTTWAL